MIALTLPWPSAKLNPNNSKGMHWATTSAVRKSARLESWALAKAAMTKAACAPGSFGTCAVSLAITFIQPDRRARDRDNLLASMKPALDGIADALAINDAQFDPIVLRREYGTKPGSVRIVISVAA